MKTTVDIDLTLDVTEEAKICFTCNKKKCSPNHCKRYKQGMKNIKQGENRRRTNEKG